LGLDISVRRESIWNELTEDLEDLKCRTRNSKQEHEFEEL